MEFKINREIFLDGIQKTLGIVEKKTTIPILNNILIKAEAGKIKIIAIFFCFDTELPSFI